MDSEFRQSEKEGIISTEQSIYNKGCYQLAYMNNALVINDTKNDDRAHRHWLSEDFELDPNQWDQINRGYMSRGKIQLFKGSCLAGIDKSWLSDIRVRELMEKYLERFQSFPLVISNGINTVRLEHMWEPAEILYSINELGAEVIAEANQ